MQQTWGVLVVSWAALGAALELVFPPSSGIGRPQALMVTLTPDPICTVSRRRALEGWRCNLPGNGCSTPESTSCWQIVHLAISGTSQGVASSLWRMRAKGSMPILIARGLCTINKAGVLSDPVALLSGVAMETFPCNCIWTQSHVIFAGVVVLTVGVVVNVGI